MSITTTSPWFTAVPDQRRYAILQGNDIADVVVIGGGIVGIMAAWNLAKQGQRVIVLEKNHIAAGNTGLTTAFLSRVPDAWLPGLAKKYGVGFCQKLLQTTSAAQQELFNLIKTEQIECDFTPCSSYIYVYDTADSRLTDWWKIYQQCDTTAQFINNPQRLKTGAPMAAAIQVPNEAHFHIRKFLLGLLQRPQAKNITVYEESPVADIIVRRGSVLVQTVQGQVKAKRLVVATGLPDGLFPELQPLFQHTITHVITADCGPAMPISNDLFWDLNMPYFYYRRMSDHTIMVGGVDHPADQLLGPGVAEQTLQRFLQQYFSDQPYTVKNSWSGSIFLTEDELPYIAVHPQYSQVMIASGLGGNGMVMGSMAGTMVAQTPSTLFGWQRTKVSIATVPIRPLLQRYPEITKITITCLRVLIPLIYLLALILPGYYFFQARGSLAFIQAPDASTISLLIFPLFGLYAFTFVWVQLMIGTNLPYLRGIFRWSETYHRTQGLFTLLFALTHPLLLLFGVGFEAYRQFQFVNPQLLPWAILGQVQLFLLLLTVATALLRKRPWLQQRWKYIHYLNYLIFGLVWVHGWFIGSDTQLPPFRYVWIAFGIIGLISIANRLRLAFTKNIITNTISQKQFIPVAAVSAVKPNQSLCVTVRGKKLALFCVADHYYAINNACSHAGGPLCQGKLSGQIIQCPWHGARFDVTNGKVIGPPAQSNIASYRTRVTANQVEVEC